MQQTRHVLHSIFCKAVAVQALEFDAGQRSWALQQDALHAAAQQQLKQEVAASQAAVEAQRTAQLADWAAEEQEDALRRHQVCCPPTCTEYPPLLLLSVLALLMEWNTSEGAGHHGLLQVSLSVTCFVCCPSDGATYLAWHIQRHAGQCGLSQV